MISTLSNLEEFNARRIRAWSKNTAYWLAGPLRHVEDIGDTIIDNIIRSINNVKPQPLVVDMGFGDAWIFKALIERNMHVRYVGIDSNSSFVDAAKLQYSNCDNCEFICADLNQPLKTDIRADIVVNSFNFFELSNLKNGMENARGLLAKDGTLIVATIDKTFLILAVSNSQEEFYENLRLYERLPGIKYSFQPIDLGSGPSDELEYPSVLYSLDDYLNAAAANGLELAYYKELVFTSKPIPKIYLIFNLQGK